MNDARGKTVILSQKKVENKTNEIVETPLMKQYNAIKSKYPDALLLFRVGDFYETFGEDAIRASKILGIVLTKRANGSAMYIELAGFPHHSLDSYLPKLVRAGLRVAICDQLEDPKLTKKIVKRGVTELVTPGLSFNDKILDHKTNNFLASIFTDKDLFGIAFIDISTGEFTIAQGNKDYIDKLIQGFRPSEVIYTKSKRTFFQEWLGDKYCLNTLDDWAYAFDYGYERLTRHFDTKNLKGFGIENLQHGIIAAGAILHYLEETQHHQTSHIQNISRIEEEKYVWLDRFTIRNLELFYSANENAKTLIDVIDNTNSPMGARMLKRWIVLPLKDKTAIDERLEIVELFYQNEELTQNICSSLKQVGDIERLISKVAVNRIMPREIVQLKRALESIEQIKLHLTNVKLESLARISDQLNPCKIIKDKIEKEITSEPPLLVNKGGFIESGVDAELDELRRLMNSGKDYLLEIQQREIERTGITSLKISFNNVFGYYIEVRNTHKEKVPPEWIRKQTLTSGERYITEELKEYETKILGAEEKIIVIEQRIYSELVNAISEYISTIQVNSGLLAFIDCLTSFSKTSRDNKYVKPNINDSIVLDIKAGRHPVIEQLMPIGEPYIPNDIYLDDTSQQIIVITGPNMAGKSALLRQTALIVLMAQIGCFVPADNANIGIVDKIFTRVGASDNLSSGESTFMVEMNETASILNNLSPRSLVLLDEIGRGTSTYDGISIAWAIAEYLHEHQISKARVLFATHYHELNELTKSFDRIKNYNVSIKELSNKVIFLRKLVPGGSEHSFGIHVAQMAGMPKNVINRANEILADLEKNESTHEDKKRPKKSSKKNQDEFQLSFFQLDDPILEDIRDKIKNLDINNLTPMEALLKLEEIKKMVGK